MSGSGNPFNLGFPASNIGASQPAQYVPAVTVTNTLRVVQSSTGSDAVGLHAKSGGAGGTANLALLPDAGGEIATAGPIVGLGAALPATAGAGFLCLNVNGQEVRIPLLTPAQAGG